MADIHFSPKSIGAASAALALLDIHVNDIKVWILGVSFYKQTSVSVKDSLSLYISLSLLLSLSLSFTLSGI